VKKEWEYRVDEMGGVLRGARPEELEAYLNEAAADGWEPHLVESQSSNNRLLVILRRPRGVRTRDRSHTWP
jgi:hypothetical protein